MRPWPREFFTLFFYAYVIIILIRMDLVTRILEDSQALCPEQSGQGQRAMSRTIWGRRLARSMSGSEDPTTMLWVNAERAFLGLPPLDRLHVSVQPPPKSSGDQNVQASSFPLSSWSSTSYLSWNPITKIILIVTQVTCEIETYGHAHGYP